jgi:DNA-directed RNA polymerase subunit RPC12/RpoP
MSFESHRHEWRHVDDDHKRNLLRCTVCGLEGHQVGGSIQAHKRRKQAPAARLISYRCGICGSQGHSRATCGERVP